MMSFDFLNDRALGRVWDALPNARVVGGAVRDALAGLQVADIDLATPDVPELVIEALVAARVKVVPTGLAHGTVTAVVDGHGFEVTTLRRDVQTDGRHAVVAFTADWQQDAARRDLTFNAMSTGRDGRVCDYFGGIADLRAGQVRFVGDPAARIAEDYLRVLRLFRFHARFGKVPPDPVTLRALRDAVPRLQHLSVERVWNEVRRILAAPDPTASVALMDRVGIWAAVLPEAMAVDRLKGLPADPVLRLAAMLTGDALTLATRLKLSSEDRDRLLRLTTTPSVAGSDAALRRLLADHQRADLLDRTWLDGARLEGAAEVRQRLAAMTRPVFPLEGRDVLALGIPAGPVVGAALRDVRRWWLDGGCVADRDACLIQLARAIALPNMHSKR